MDLAFLAGLKLTPYEMGILYSHSKIPNPKSKIQNIL